MVAAMIPSAVASAAMGTALAFTSMSVSLTTPVSLSLAIALSAAAYLILNRVDILQTFKRLRPR
jgi:hypothetical protein